MRTTERINHSAGSLCPGCDALKRGLHPILSIAFDEIRKKFPDCHVIQGHLSIRDSDPLDCKEATHYRTFSDRSPCSEAMDLFCFRGDGKVHYERSWYAAIAEYIRETRLPLLWPAEERETGHEHFELAT
jgi:hypothetical protein